MTTLQGSAPSPGTLGSETPATPPAQHERKREVLTHRRPSATESIADALVIKDGNIFFLTQPDGCVPLRRNHGFGLYYHDCRYLNGYTLQLGHTDPVVLVGTEADGHSAGLELTNGTVALETGGELAKELLSISWTRRLDGDELTLTDQLVIQNLGLDPVSVPLALSFGAQFEDVFTIRHLADLRPGNLHRPAWADGVLTFRYDGADGLHRSLCLFFSPEPDETEGASVRFDLSLAPRSIQTVQVTLRVQETELAPGTRPSPLPQVGQTQDTVGHRAPDWTQRFAQIETDCVLLNRVLQRSFVDLGVLRSSIGDDRFFAAGLPWFGTLFGRDSLITALQTLAFDARFAEETLRLLASRQGQKLDAWRDEEPGKILHELRVGELARLGEIPHTPYYGTIDATPLFLILLGRHAAWTGSLQLFNELRPNVENALCWMTDFAAARGKGYLAYTSSTGSGLINQGWKDSGNAIVNSDGSLARPPIALVEVQGYAYRAWLETADLYERAGDTGRSAALRQAAESLRERFEHDFWLERLGCYALALQRDGVPVEVLSSNPGQALWTGIARPDRAERTITRLMAPDLFSGWGIRTLSSGAQRYTPIGYHLGTVWPHDNSIIVAGFRRYGRDREALQVTAGLIDAASLFPVYRLPELFAGFSRQDYDVPVHYPVACHPQAWAAGSMLFLMQTCLGLCPQSFDGRLRIIRPLLPDCVDELTLHNLRVGQGCADLRFHRHADLPAEVEVLRLEGPLTVEVEPPH